MLFRIYGLDPGAYAHFWRFSPEQLAETGASRVTVEAKPSAPCRISLDDAEIGEQVILLSHEHQPNLSAYRQGGPIFIRDTARRFDRIDVIPPAFSRRTLSLRAYDKSHAMVDADLVEGAEAAPLIEKMFASADVAYIHAHYARRGCFAATIERA